MSNRLCTVLNSYFCTSSFQKCHLWYCLSQWVDMQFYVFFFFFCYKQLPLTFLYLIHVIIANSYICNNYMNILFIQEMGNESKCSPLKDAKPGVHFLLNRLDQECRLMCIFSNVCPYSTQWNLLQADFINTKCTLKAPGK